MKILCPNCEALTECEFEIEIYFCKNCQEDFAAYEKPAQVELLKLLENANLRIENLKMSPEHQARVQAVKHMLEITAFLRKIMVLGLLRGSPRLRDEALRILDGVETSDTDGSNTQDGDICPDCGGGGEVVGDYFSDDGMTTCTRCNGKGAM